MRGLLFRDVLVKRIRQNRKTQTRRLDLRDLYPVGAGVAVRETWRVRSRMVVRGAASVGGPLTRLAGALVVLEYRADGARREVRFSEAQWTPKLEKQAAVTLDKWRPSIFLPTWAVRERLIVRATRLERLHEITPADVAAEGVGPDSLRELLEGQDKVKRLPPALASDALRAIASGDPLECWRIAWTAINGAESWNANPTVRVIDFRRAP